MGHVLGTTWDYKLVQGGPVLKGRYLLWLKPDADACLELKNTTIRWLQVVQHECANFFVAQEKLVCDRIPRRACGVIGRVLLLSFANVRVVAFATGYLLEFCSASFSWAWCLGVGGRGPQALGICRPQRGGVRKV